MVSLVLQRHAVILKVLSKNRGEVIIVCRLARLYQGQNKSYRIITPYDAQRNAIESDLKNADLPWENRVFNVDSFQGPLYPSISTVRL